GEALTFAVTFFPTLFAVQLLSGLAIGLGVILLIIPGLYLVGRLALAAPSVADRSLYNPFEALKSSWELTRNNGWAIFFFLFLVTIVIFIAAMIVGLVIGLIAGTDGGIGQMIGGVFEAGFSALSSLISIAISAAAYRQLVTRASSDVFQ
ncbi:MAG: glycerophosphoryl diester phosphodiesterase membrane domain-containing protein, partial [Afipia sp.]|nr:glycerophosphoryl diester phosphodiesterase membrane domain-containing protein [Afipia sp.]